MVPACLSRIRHSCAHLPTTHRPFPGSFGNAFAAEPLTSPASPGQRFENVYRVRVSARTTPGVRTHARNWHLVGSDRGNRGTKRVPHLGADHASSRRVSDEVMVPDCWDGASLFRPPIFLVDCYILVKAVSYRMHNQGACLRPMCLHDPFLNHESSNPYHWLDCTFSLTAPDDDFEKAIEVRTV